MPVSFVSSQSAGSGVSIAAGAGTNRLCLWMWTSANGNTRYPTSVTWNGVSVGQLVVAHGGANNTPGVGVWAIKESEIPVGAATLSVTFNISPANGTYRLITLADVEQSYTPYATDATAGGSGLTSIARSVSVPADGIALMVARAGTTTDPGTDVTWTNATEAFDATGAATAARGAAAYNTTAGSQTLTASWANAVAATAYALALSPFGSASVAPIVAYYSMQD